MADKETTASGMINFGSKKTKEKAKAKQHKIETNLNDNKQRAFQAKKQPVDHSKRQATIDVGKELVSKFFHGFSETERANVKADFDDQLIFRLAEHYDDAIMAFCEDNDEYHEPEKQRKLATEFVGGVSLATAIKLYRSSTESEKAKNHSYNSLDRTKIKIPQQLGILLDAIGKTDLPGDNHFRLNDQNYAARRHMIRGTTYVLGDNKIKEYIRKDRNMDLNINDLHFYFENENYFINMIDDSTSSIERLKRIGRRIYREAAEKNITFKFNGKSYSMRLPHFDLPDEMTLDDIGKILSNSFFEDFKAENADLVKAMGGLLLMVSKQSWLRNAAKKMKELDEIFNGTPFADETFKDVMKTCEVWNINDFFKQEDINDLAIDAIEKWNTGDNYTFKKFLNMVEMEFSEFGSEAQIVQVDRDHIDTKHKTQWNWHSYRFKGRATSRSMFKTIHDHTALIGLMTGFTKNIEMKSDYQVDYNLTNRSILIEFLKKDFQK